MQVAAREQLEESKSTIENLLDWLSNVDKDAEHGEKKCQPVIKQNGNHFHEDDTDGLVGEDDELNGNLLEVRQQNASQADGGEKPEEDNLNKQYQKIKVLHMSTSCFECLSLSFCAFCAVFGNNMRQVRNYMK